MDMDIYRRIGLVCSRIPRGRVATYGQIALLCGKPGNSRQVGYALKKGLAGEDVPAHRVVNAAGILSGAAHLRPWISSAFFCGRKVWRCCGPLRDGRRI